MHTGPQRDDIVLFQYPNISEGEGEGERGRGSLYKDVLSQPCGNVSFPSVSETVATLCTGTVVFLKHWWRNPFFSHGSMPSSWFQETVLSHKGGDWQNVVSADLLVETARTQQMGFGTETPRYWHDLIWMDKFAHRLPANHRVSKLVEVT